MRHGLGWLEIKQQLFLASPKGATGTMCGTLLPRLLLGVFEAADRLTCILSIFVMGELLLAGVQLASPGVVF